MADKYVNNTGLSRFLTQVKSWVMANVDAITNDGLREIIGNTSELGAQGAVWLDGNIDEVIGGVLPVEYGGTGAQELPQATTTTLGMVKVGSGLVVTSDGTLSLDVSSASGVSF